MVFGDGFDKSLLLILIADRHNREQIARLVSLIPRELINKIQDELKNRKSDNNFKSLEFTKAIRDDNGTTSMFRIKINNNSLRIQLSIWGQNIQNTEEVYDLDLGKIDLEHINDSDLTYVGSYYFSYSSLFMGIGPMICESDGVGYEIYINDKDKFVIQVTGNHVYDKAINNDILSNSIMIEDLISRSSVNNLVRRKKK